MPGRAIANKFLTSENKAKIKKCHQCLEKCEPLKIPYCITRALVNAAKGDLDNALIFCGSEAWRNNKIDTVHDIVVDLFY